MRSDKHLLRSSADSAKPFCGNSDLGRRTSPEQIGGRRRNHQKVRIKFCNSVPGLCHRELIGLGIYDKSFVTCLFYLVRREQQLERNMRIAAAEVSRASEVPVRIDECKLHHAVLGKSATTAAGASISCTFAGANRFRLARKNELILSRISGTLALGLHPVSRVSFAWFET